MDDSRLALLDLKYHDVSRRRGLFYKMQERDLVESICVESDVIAAMETPPRPHGHACGGSSCGGEGTQAGLHGGLGHLKLNDQARGPSCARDPFKSHAERVEKLIASL